MNEDDWLLGVREAPWDQREASNGHKSISREAVMQTAMPVIYIDGLHFPDCD